MKSLFAICLLLMLSSFVAVADTGPPDLLPTGYTIEQSIVVGSPVVSLQASINQDGYAYLCLPCELYANSIARISFSNCNDLTCQKQDVTIRLDAPVRKFSNTDYLTNLHPENPQPLYNSPGLINCPLPFT